MLTSLFIANIIGDTTLRENCRVLCVSQLTVTNSLAPGQNGDN